MRPRWLGQHCDHSYPGMTRCSVHSMCAAPPGLLLHKADTGAGTVERKLVHTHGAIQEPRYNPRPCTHHRICTCLSCHHNYHDCCNPTGMYVHHMHRQSSQGHTCMMNLRNVRGHCIRWGIPGHRNPHLSSRACRHTSL